MTIALWDRTFALQRLSAAIGVTNILLNGDWPYQDSKEALLRIVRAFEKKKSDIESLDQDVGDDILRPHCVDARDLLSRMAGLIGFIIRSSEVRNGFELYAPIRAIGRALLGVDIHLIIGSEWNYVPFAYPLPISILNEFVLVGLPAFEASNALIAPAAGHELGHAVWRRTDLRKELTKRVDAEIVKIVSDRWGDFSGDFHSGANKDALLDDLEARSIWAVASNIAARQCEEIFCDIIGTYIFGQSFIFALMYLLLPDNGARQSTAYPSSRRRAEYITSAAERFSVAVPSEFVSSFRNQDPPDDKYARAADDAVQVLVPEIIDSVANYASRKGIVLPDPEASRRSKDVLKDLQPPMNYNSVGELLNGAWDVRRELSSWSIPGVVDEGRKLAILNDLIFQEPGDSRVVFAEQRPL